MALNAGARVGPYEILAPLGAGGMGEVYRARDSRLGRDVAVKVLPSDVAGDSERLARFRREAHVLASLNHPGIAAIYGLEEFDGKPCLVLELVEGETLDQRLTRGPVPVEEALEMARQMAEALEEAHERGIVHRDLKPSNVKLTPGGKIKVLDFGLAKAYAGEQGAGANDASHSPTLTRGTESGVLLGTAAYMSPEQARGKVVDKRTDIWAFGVVLFEMLAGRRLFQGETVSDTLAAILKTEPDWSVLPREAPPQLRELLRRCLVRDPRGRLRDIGEARLQLQEKLLEAESGSPGQASLRRPVALILGVAAAAAALVAGFLLGRAGSSLPFPRPAPVTRGVIELPPDAPLALGVSVPAIGYESTLIALSPDGHWLAYVGESATGRTQLYLRPLAGLDVKAVPGTDGALSPFFSPDGRWLGFLTADKVKKVALEGGAPITLCNARTPTHANWTRDDWIYFGESESTILSRVAVSGGQPREVAKLEDAGFRQILPEGGTGLLERKGTSQSGDYSSVETLALDSLQRKSILQQGFAPRYSPSGHLLFARAANLYSVRFDPQQLRVLGEPTPVASGVSMESLFGQLQVAVSDGGLIAYVPGSDRSVGRLGWVDREGKIELLPVPERIYGVVQLSPDGTRLAVEVADVMDYVWIYDLVRNQGRKLSVNGSSGSPIWSPDGESIVVDCFGCAEPGLYRLNVGERSGAVSARLWTGTPHLIPDSFLPDGSAVLASSYEGGSIGLLSTAPGSSVEWLETPGNAWGASPSPDGRYVAYSSDETGRNEIWVRSVSNPSTPRQVSVDGGLEPLWFHDRIFYRQGRQWFAARVTTAQTSFDWETPKPVVETDFVDTSGRSYDLSPDGQRLILVKRAREPIRSKIVFIQNWFEDQTSRGPSGASPR